MPYINIEFTQNEYTSLKLKAKQCNIKSARSYCYKAIMDTLPPVEAQEGVAPPTTGGNLDHFKLLGVNQLALPALGPITVPPSLKEEE